MESFDGNDVCVQINSEKTVGWTSSDICVQRTIDRIYLSKDFQTRNSIQKPQPLISQPNVDSKGFTHMQTLDIHTCKQ